MSGQVRVLWWWRKRWIGPLFYRWPPIFVYDWSIMIGPLEVRKWKT